MLYSSVSLLTNSSFKKYLWNASCTPVCLWCPGDTNGIPMVLALRRLQFVRENETGKQVIARACWPGDKQNAQSVSQAASRLLQRWWWLRLGDRQHCILSFSWILFLLILWLGPNLCLLLEFIVICLLLNNETGKWGHLQKSCEIH